MKYKLIATDFDGTLLNDYGEVSESSINTFIRYREKGYFIVGVTGRSLDEVMDVVDISIFDYLILNNGSYLYDVKMKVGEYISNLFFEEVFGITSIVEKESKKIHYYSGSICYCCSDIDKLNYIDYLYEINEKIVQINIFLKDFGLGEYYLNIINQKYFVNCFIMQDSNSSLKMLMINPKGVNKGITLERLGRILNVSLSEMIYFGDSVNDLDVMDIVGCSVAMGNSFDSIKERADYITLSNNEEGISIFLESFIS